MKQITTKNPATGQELETYALYDDEQIVNCIEEGHQSFQKWRKTSIVERAKLMNKAAEVLESHKQEYAKWMALEMGKPVKDALAEVEKCAWVCRYYASEAAGFLSDEHVETAAQKSYISYQPLGLLLAVMPWNYPFWQVFRFAAPSLMAGNTAILKHASNVPKCALLIEDVFLKAGFPKAVFQTLLAESAQVELMLSHPHVKAVSLTGSEKAGSAVAALAGKYMKKSVLELGGNDAYLVLEDADIDLAVEQCVASRLLNNGQSCISAKRYIVDASVYDEFLEKCILEFQKYSIGDPFDENVDLGPLARADIKAELHQQVLESIEKGAECAYVGEVNGEENCFYPPTILTGVKKGMPAYNQELFGPVASIIKVKNEQEAIDKANDSVYGLGACVFSKDVAKAERIAREDLQAGCCFVNQFVKSDPRLAFGGIKNSGFGRELSRAGILEFVNAKTVYVR